MRSGELTSDGTSAGFNRLLNRWIIHTLVSHIHVYVVSLFHDCNSMAYNAMRIMLFYQRLQSDVVSQGTSLRVDASLRFTPPIL